MAPIEVANNLSSVYVSGTAPTTVVDLRWKRFPTALSFPLAYEALAEAALRIGVVPAAVRHDGCHAFSDT